MIWFDRYDLPNKFLDSQKKIDFASMENSIHQQSNPIAHHL